MAKTTVLRYALYQTKDLNSKIIGTSANKAELKRLRTSWKYQILVSHITSEIYDNVKKEWLP